MYDRQQENIEVFGVKGLKTIKRRIKLLFSLKDREDHTVLFIHDLDEGSNAINASLILSSGVGKS